MRTKLQEQVEQKIGRNLLRYQLVEVRLKQALPLRNLKLSSEGLEELAKEAEKKSLVTLGGLVPDYLAAFEALTPDGDGVFRLAVSSFVEGRNWLAHRLLLESNGLATVEDSQTCMDRLDRDYDAAESIARHVMDLHQFLITSIKTFIDFWAEAEPGAAGIAQACQRHAEHLALLYGDAISVQIEMPLLEILAEVMATIEASSAREDGWVLFTPVGYNMRKSFPNVPPRLLSVAKQIEQYEFEERPVKPGAGNTWMFRRRRAGILHNGRV